MGITQNDIDNIHKLESYLKTPCPFCKMKKLFGVKARTNIYCGETNQTEALIKCHGCGCTVSAYGDTYEQARQVALAKWETRP